MNFVPCVTWVQKGKAASTPHKLQLSPEELKVLVEETKSSCQSENPADATEEDENSEEDIDEECQDEVIEKCNDVEVGDDDAENDDFESRYNLDSYDNDDDQNPLFTINDLAVHVDNKDDNYLSDEESEGDAEEKEDFSIKDSDNLLIVGHVEDESSVLEIYVYNQDDDVFYVHHDIVLPSYPLALAWLDFHPSEETPGNYVAVGDMSPVIKIWDLDVVDVLEPDYTLGKIPKKKKEKIKMKELKYHTDAVLSLSWNKEIRNLLASGSADSTVIVWDLQEGTCLNHISLHSNKVQALEWHPTETQFLLSGCTDGFLKIYDCRSDGESKSWKVNGEIERIVWNISDSFKFFCSTDQGYIYLIDMRNDSIECSLQAHSEGVTGLDISPQKPDVLISASMDRTLKVWDLKNKIKSLKLKVGSIYTAKAAPDQELTVAVGGNNASNSLKILNLSKDLFASENNESSRQQKYSKVKAKEKEFQVDTKLNKRKIYSDAEFTEKQEHKNVNIKEENKLQSYSTVNKRKIYDDSQQKHNKVKVKKEKEFRGDTKLNKRKIYSESQQKHNNVKVKKEKEFQGRYTT